MDSKTLSRTKEKADNYFLKGSFKSALKAYEEVLQCSAKDPRISLRIGDICRKMGMCQGAIDAYKRAADIFVRLGFIVKAVAVCKMMIDIDPSQKEVQRRMVWLYAKKTGSEEQTDRANQAALVSSVSSSDDKQQMPRTPLFSDFKRDELFDVVKRVQYKALSPGEFVFKEGDPGDSIYILSSGQVEVIGSKGESDVVFFCLNEGDFFGEFGFFSNAKRRFSVRAIDSTGLLEIRRNDLNDIIQKHPRVSKVILEFYKERVVDRLMALSPMFGLLTAADRRVILDSLSLESFKTGTDVVREGEKGNTMYLIKSGRVNVWVRDKKRGKIILTELEEGDFFGEIGLVTDRARVATVTAVTNIETVSFSRAMVGDMINKYPKTKEVLHKVMQSRLTGIVKAREMPATAHLV